MFETFPKIGLVGSNGYWGPQLRRVLEDLDCLIFPCDLKGDVTCKDYKQLTSISYNNLKGNTSKLSINAVVIATPPDTHFEIAKYFLSNKVATFIEKPMTCTTKEAAELWSLATQSNTTLMVGHTFIYSSAVQKMKEIIDSGELGDIYYIDCQWRNLGLFQKTNVIFDLAPHPLSIIFYLLNKKVNRVNFVKYSHILDNVPDTALVTLEFDKCQAFLHLSWLNPQKIRIFTIVGSKKMLVFDDTEQLDKIKIYDKSVVYHDKYDSFGTFNMSYRYGDTHIPKIDVSEPLKNEMKHFLDCVNNGKYPETDAYDGLRVVQILEDTSGD